jgi:phage repressor protein C with HTH and peptisase S24 domain
MRERIKDLEAFKKARRDGIHERISEAARFCGSAAELARISSFPDPTIRKWMKGSTEPSVTNLLAIAYASGLHPHWLLTGTGPKKPGGSDDEFAYINNLEVEYSEDENGQVVNTRMAFRNDWLKQHDLPSEMLCFLTAKGDAMEPTIRPGDALLVTVYFHNRGPAHKQDLVKGLEPSQRAGKEGIFVLKLDGGLVVKRLQPDLEGGYHIRSDNSRYEPLYKKAEDLVIVGKVEWIGRRL